MFDMCGTYNGCTVKGVTESSIKEALKDGTDWDDNWMHFDGEEE